MSGRPANPAPNTGYEHHTLQLLQLHGHSAHADPSPDSHHDFPCQDDATMTSTTDREGLPHSGASSSSKHTAASGVPSTFGLPSLWKQMAGHVSGRPGLQETDAISDRESAATTIFSSQSKRKRDRDTNFVHSLKR